MTEDLVRREDHDGIAVLTISNPPVNALGLATRQALIAAIAALEADDGIRAVVLTGAGKVFVGGADISEFDRPPEAPHLPDVIAAIEAARKPWIAAVNGAALGGGAELALGCSCRILATTARIALPETKLGIIPGAGGTQRLPRLIGIAAAIDVITGGREITADEAHDSGLADGLAGDDLIRTALDFARGLTGPLPSPAAMRPLEDPGAEFWDKARARIAKAARGNPAPLAALAAIHEGATAGFAAGIRLERETFLRLRRSDEAAALRYLFFAERAAPRPASPRGITPAPLARIGVIGGGTMGSGIAAALANAGLPVTLAETSPEALATGMARLTAIFAAQVKRGLHDAAAAEARIALVTGTVGLADLSCCDLALWDLRARSLGVPVYDLFGGPLRDEIAVYANGWNYDYPDADGWARASERPLRDGYSFLKCYPLAMPSDTGGTLRHPGRKSASPELIALGVDRIRRLRDLAGDSVRIAIDLCAAVAPADLLRFARQIEDCGIEWLEEAGDPADPGAFTAIAAGTPIPLAAGERFFGLAGFRDLIASRAVSVLQPDLGTCGGFSEFQQIAALANSYSHKISPHNCGGAVLTAASLQMAACTANFLALETFPYFRDQPGYVGLTLFDPLDRISQGHIAVDRTPGLGVQADHAAIAPFLFAECPAPRPGNR